MPFRKKAVEEKTVEWLKPFRKKAVYLAEAVEEDAVEEKTVEWLKPLKKMPFNWLVLVILFNAEGK